jgi:hypothetical protein
VRLLGAEEHRKIMSLHLQADLQANTDRFVASVKSTGIAWGLRSPDGWAYCPSIHTDTDVLLFWSARAYAERHAKEEWQSYEATSIPLDEFIDNWLRGMHQDGLLVGVNFNADLAGLELTPRELAAALTGEA